MAQNQPQGGRSATRGEVSRLYALALAVVEEPERATTVVSRVLTEANPGDTFDELLESLLTRAVALRAEMAAGGPPVPVQIPAPDTFGRYAGEPLSPDQWSALWNALTGGDAETRHLNAALAALDEEISQFPIHDEDIP